ncbi:MAG: hypothetical protein JXR68_13430 [Bacteroidales bacterium]|nr:hypothetical protein [Paludibacteraceae bacterium]MBN2664645.1 hypothetical protein [Bacteroidales bacterium]
MHYGLHSIIFLIKSLKNNLTASFLNLSFAFWTLYLLFRIQYWPCGPSIFGFQLLFIISFIITIVYIGLHFSKSGNLKIPQILLILYFIFTITISFIHSDKIYYFFTLNEVTQKDNRENNYQAWDKYSWFLYCVDKQNEAIEANLKAQKIVEKKLKKDFVQELYYDLKNLKRHNQLIRDKNWNDLYE